MPLNELLLREFDVEMPNTRKTLERVPADKWDCKPHEKSGTLGWLAAHVATLPGFTIAVVQTPEMEIAGAVFPKVAKHAELLDAFTNVSKEARAAVLDDRLAGRTLVKREVGRQIANLVEVDLGIVMRVQIEFAGRRL